MPELPEIYNISEQLNKEIVSLAITEVVVNQEKSINQPIDVFQASLVEQEIISVTSIGKWIIINLKSRDRILINLGMGGDLLYNQELPEKKHQALIKFNNGYLLSFRFWWFGSIHFVEYGKIHDMTNKLGQDIFRDSISKKQFLSLFVSRKGSLKSFLLSQKNIAGIGNYYIHDIFFKAKINPLKKINELSTRKLGILYDVIINEFLDSISKRGAHYELDIYNNHGEFVANNVAYKEGQLCICGSVIKKVKTGSTSSYFCPKCQK